MQKDRDEFESVDIENEVIKLDGITPHTVIEKSRNTTNEPGNSKSDAGLQLIEHPQELEMTATIQFPARWMYDENLERLFLSLLHSRNLVPLQESPRIVFKLPATKHLLGEYI